MIAPLIAFSLLGLIIFYLQNLVFFPYVHLRLLALLLFYVGLRPSLALALALGLVLGCLQDSYATTPFGVHLGASLVLVAMARYFRRGLLLQQLGFQALASLVALVVTGGVLAVRHLHAELPAPFSPRPDHGARHGDPGYCGPGTVDASSGAGRGSLPAPSRLAAQK